jgi:hypothetical protein
MRAPCIGSSQLNERNVDDTPDLAVSVCAGITINGVAAAESIRALNLKERTTT